MNISLFIVCGCSSEDEHGYDFYTRSFVLTLFELNDHYSNEGFFSCI